ncbi:hypothetical protein BS78_04G235100 [Paspalum vaginatum]|nr:hypothetical protein BS78_04G235100 [Paspalum vaginatum]
MARMSRFPSPRAPIPPRPASSVDLLAGIGGVLRRGEPRRPPGQAGPPVEPNRLRRLIMVTPSCLRGRICRRVLAAPCVCSPPIPTLHHHGA